MITVRREKDSDKQQVRQLWKLCFNDDEEFMDWFFDQRWLPDYGVVADDAGRIAAAMQGWPYTLCVRGRSVPACMLCGVSTHPDYRGRGLMRQALTLFMTQARGREEYAVFHTPAAHPTFFSCLHYSTTDSAFVTSDSPQPGRLYGRSFDVPCAAGLAERLYPAYTKLEGRYSGIVRRTPKDMRLKLADYASDGARIVYCETDNAQTVAYAVYHIADDGIDTVEFAVPDVVWRDRLLSLLVKDRPAHIRAKLPPDMGDMLPDGYFAELKPTGVMGAANISQLLALLAGFIDITVCVKDHMLAQNEGVFDFTGKTVHAQPDMTMDSGRLTQLLAGYQTLDELVAAGHVVIHNFAAARLLDKRLEKQVCFVWEEY